MVWPEMRRSQLLTGGYKIMFQQSLVREPALACLHVSGSIVRVVLRARSPSMEQVAAMDDRPCHMELDRTRVSIRVGYLNVELTVYFAVTSLSLSM
jgi:hypothetical protein